MAMEAVTDKPTSELDYTLRAPLLLLSQTFCIMSFLRSLARRHGGGSEMSRIGRRGIHGASGKISALKKSTVSVQEAQGRMIKAALKLVAENAKLKKELVNALGGAAATSTLLGVPLGHNSSFLQGSAFAPPYIRDAICSASSSSITEEGKDLTDLRVLADVGDIPIQELRDCGIEKERLMKVISDSVKLVIEEEPLRPLVLGGDQSITFPVVEAIYEKHGGPVDILHFDARPNLFHSFQDNYYSHLSPFARILEKGYARQLTQVGLRSITKEESDQAKKFGVKQYEMRTFANHVSYLEQLKLGDGEGVKGVYISIDVGCLDPGYAPGVSHYEAGGLAFRDVMRVLQKLKGNIVGADVVEYNPKQDTPNGITAMVAAKFVTQLAAKMSISKS